MTPPPPMRALSLVMVAVLLAACGGQQAPSASVVRPSSPAVITIVMPVAGQEVTGARIVSQTTTNIRPDEGHVHLYVDHVLVSMNYGLEQDLPVVPGTYVLQAEFVAADHAPFNPRVRSADTIFTVR